MINGNLSDENSSNVNKNIIRDVTSFEVGIHKPFTTNSTEATYVNTSLNLPHNDQVESPNRRELRKGADSLIIQGERMKKRASRSDGITEIPIGTIVQVSVKDIDRVRTDQLMPN